jgi:hypothetical protein
MEQMTVQSNHDQSTDLSNDRKNVPKGTRDSRKAKAACLMEMALLMSA